MGRYLEDLYLEQREPAFQLNRSALRAFFCFKLGLNTTVYFECISGILEGDPPLDTKLLTVIEAEITLRGE